MDLEGCLSLPGITGEVPRAEQVVVEALICRVKGPDEGRGLSGPYFAARDRSSGRGAIYR